MEHKLRLLSRRAIPPWRGSGRDRNPRSVCEGERGRRQPEQPRAGRPRRHRRRRRRTGRGPRLAGQGREVVVLEARDRIGGRMFTDRTSPPVPENGCEWIHGENASAWGRGLQPDPGPLAKGLSIQRETVVKRVEYSTTSVTVSAERQGRTVRYTARSAVVALPVTALAADAIAFSPRPPKVKTEVFTSAPSQSR
ncbi:FAD-dependent oxidoreductase [Streptomyces antimycoticus]|uniref:FAD-dependent oxidoreductase n=1 Tax=Streptomyces antimycoticus TaxID=68175 RepID=UPI0036A50290